MAGKPIKQRRLHLPGLTLPMLAAVTPPEVELRLVSETVEDIPFEERWDLVGLTGMGSGIIRAWQIADRFREQGTTVVIGGIAASLSEEALQLEHADALVIGEGEEIWPRLLADFAAGRLQTVYRMRHRPPIDALPEPRYDLLDQRTLGLWRPVQATRGCPFPCSFCSVTAFFEGGYRKRPIEQVIRDVRAAKRSGSKYITFIDDNIGVDFNYSAALWEALIDEDIIWMSQCSLHIAERPEMMRLAHRSGCRLLSFGIESTNPDSLAAVQKTFNKPERYIELFDRLREHGIDVSTEMMIGMEEDDPRVFRQTLDFIMRARISIPRLHIITPIPGTPLFEEMEREERILTRDFQRYSGGRVVFRPRHIGPERLQREYWSMYEQLFSWRGIAHRAGRNPARLGAVMRGVVMGVNLHYRNHIRRRICPGIV